MFKTFSAVLVANIITIMFMVVLFIGGSIIHMYYYNYDVAESLATEYEIIIGKDNNLTWVEIFKFIIYYWINV